MGPDISEQCANNYKKLGRLAARISLGWNDRWRSDPRPSWPEDSGRWSRESREGLKADPTDVNACAVFVWRTTSRSPASHTHFDSDSFDVIGRGDRLLAGNTGGNVTTTLTCSNGHAFGFLAFIVERP